MPYLNTTKYQIPYFQPNYKIQPPDLSAGQEQKATRIIDNEESGIMTVHNSLIDGVVSEGVFRDNLSGTLFQGRLFQNVATLTSLYRKLYTPPVSSKAIAQNLSGVVFQGTTTYNPIGLSKLLTQANANPALVTLYSGINQQSQVRQIGSTNFIENIGLTVQIHGETGFIPSSDPIRWVINDVKQDTLLYAAIQETGFPGRPRSTLKFNQLTPITSYTLLSGTPQGFGPNGSVLVGTRKSGLNTVIDLNPPGKVTIQTVLDHKHTNHNPHGNPLLISGNVISSGITVYGTLNANKVFGYQLITTSGNLLLQQGLIQEPINHNVFISGNLTVQQTTGLSGTVFSNFNPQNTVQVLNTLTVSGLGMLTVSGNSFWTGNVVTTPGVLVDGFNFNAAEQLIDGANVPNSVHFHSKYAQHRSMSYSPRFPNVGFRIQNRSVSIRHRHQLTPHENSIGLWGRPDFTFGPLCLSGVIAVGMVVPHGFVQWKDITVHGRVDNQSWANTQNLGTDSKYLLGLHDTTGAEVFFNESGISYQQNVWKATKMTGMSGIWNVGDNFTLRSEMYSYSGSIVDLGSIVLNYYTVSIPKPAIGYGTLYGGTYGFTTD